LVLKSFIIFYHYAVNNYLFGRNIDSNSLYLHLHTSNHYYFIYSFDFDYYFDYE